MIILVVWWSFGNLEYDCLLVEVNNYLILANSYESVSWNIYFNMMEDDDEIDVLGDFNLENLLTKNEQQM